MTRIGGRQGIRKASGQARLPNRSASSFATLPFLAFIVVLSAAALEHVRASAVEKTTIIGTVVAPAAFEIEREPGKAAKQG